MTSNRPILNGINLSKRFRIKTTPTAPDGILTAVDDVCLDINHGETHGIAGESGCGKSTLGKLLAGLLPADSGEVHYHDTPLTGMSGEEYNSFRRQTQMIFQDPFSSLNPRMRIGDIIAEPLLISGKDSAASRRIKVAEIMQTVGISPEQYNRFPHEFSGGQRQRIGIARALTSSPEIIIADEPVSSLDISIQAQIINLLQSMKSAYSLSLVMISHDLSVLRHMCDRVSIMYLGTIVESAPAVELFQNCLHPYTEALIASVPGINRVGGRKKILLRDDIPSPLAVPTGCRFHPRCHYAGEICKQNTPPLDEKSAEHRAACHFSKEIYQT
jgi:peptide/nickel transport system ATP-binding protein